MGNIEVGWYTRHRLTLYHIPGLAVRDVVIAGFVLRPVFIHPEEPFSPPNHRQSCSFLYFSSASHSKLTLSYFSEEANMKISLVDRFRNF
jgi:hypothetical protein